jgi:hypothetical protein
MIFTFKDLLRKFGDEKLERKSKLDSIERNMVMVEKILDLDSKFQAGNRKVSGSRHIKCD